MSELKLISPMLDNFMVGDAINERDGLRTYPAMRQETEEKYIIKVISIPSSPDRLDALILSGAYKDQESAMAYFRRLADEIIAETETLKQLSDLEGFLPFEDCQVVENDEANGFNVYLLSPYKRSLEKHFQNTPMTHLAAANLGLDLCAALTVARRAGYMFADLRPDNIYVTPDGEYKIGDIGFVQLDGLKYATLPDRYRSTYTAPESMDPYASPSDTMDVYALGLLLYRVYNNNILPDAANDGEPFTAPQFADYEMSEIILKACAPVPEDRWSSPVEMGQAIVSYMQRNGISDAPIVPLPTPIDPVEDNTEDATESSPTAEESATPTNDADVPSDNEEIVYIEDDFGNLAFLDDAFAATDLSEEDLNNYTGVSGELSDMLEQADDLAAHTIPEPVVAPDAIDVPIPTQEEASADMEETRMIDLPEESPDDVPQEESENVDCEEPVEEPEQTPKRKPRKWLRYAIITLVILSVLAVGAYFFIGYYFVPIDDLHIEYNNDVLIVYVDAKIDESLLEVECSFPEGTPITAEVKNGKATFTGLAENTGYTIKVRVKGFHRVTGESTTAYSTPAQTSLLHFSAVTGMTDGSMVLTFSVDGKESDQWTITYWAAGEPEMSVTFPNHTVTLNNLTIGKEYTFRLEPVDDLYITGEWEIQATASKLVYSENITVTEFANNRLSVCWTAPKGTQISSWTVRCYNDDGYSNTAVVQEPMVTFDDVDPTCNYNIEIIAHGMTDSARGFAYANSINISDFTATPQTNGSLLLEWNSDRILPDGCWITYSIDGFDISQQFPINNNSAVISPYIPGADYRFTFSAPGDDHIVGAPMVYTANDAASFSCTYYGYTVTAEDMVFKMCHTPPYSNWNVYYVASEDYTTDFAIGDKASFVIQLLKVPGYSYDTINVLYAIRDAEGNMVDISSVSFYWYYLWVDYYGALNIPNLPAQAGSYTVDVYFNGAWVATQAFTIS